MSDKSSIIENKCLWYDLGGNDHYLCMFHYPATCYDWWVICPATKLGANPGVAIVVRSEEKDSSFTFKFKDISPSYLKEFPKLENIRSPLYDSPEGLLKAFGDIVNSK